MMDLIVISCGCQDGTDELTTWIEVQKAIEPKIKNNKLEKVLSYEQVGIASLITSVRHH
jgi:Tfp pilus assembly protein PilP